jgi:hypothetical protein
MDLSGLTALLEGRLSGVSVDSRSWAAYIPAVRRAWYSEPHEDALKSYVFKGVRAYPYEATAFQAS